MPSASAEPEPSKPATRNVADDVNAAVGAWFGGSAATVTSWLTVPVAPSSSVTVNVTV